MKVWAKFWFLSSRNLTGRRTHCKNVGTKSSRISRGSVSLFLKVRGFWGSKLFKTSILKMYYWIPGILLFLEIIQILTDIPFSLVTRIYSSGQFADTGPERSRPVPSTEGEESYEPRPQLCIDSSGATRQEAQGKGQASKLSKENFWWQAVPSSSS